MTVKVTFDYEPEDEEVDAEDPTGLTSEAFDDLADQLHAVGAENVRCEAVVQ